MCPHEVGVSTHTDKAWRIACRAKLGDTDQSTQRPIMALRLQSVKSDWHIQSVEGYQSGGTICNTHCKRESEMGAARHINGMRQLLR